MYKESFFKFFEKENFNACARSINLSSRQAPSSNEYSVCKCKWTKSACDMATSYRSLPTRGKPQMFTLRDDSPLIPDP